MRRVECVSHDPSGPRVVADAVCAAYAEAPPSMQTCNMHRCAEYQVTGWSGVSVFLSKPPVAALSVSKRIMAVEKASVLSHERGVWHFSTKRRGLQVFYTTE